MAHPDAFCGRMRFYLNMRIGKGRKTASRFLVEFCPPLPRGERREENVFPLGKQRDSERINVTIYLIFSQKIDAKNRNEL